MTKLCPRGKAAAKRKFKVYPSAYANAYASRICAGKIKDPSGVKRKDFRGPKKAMGGRIGYSEGTPDRKASKQVRSKKPFETIEPKTPLADSTLIPKFLLFLTHSKASKSVPSVSLIKTCNIVFSLSVSFIIFSP